MHVCTVGPWVLVNNFLPCHGQFWDKTRRQGARWSFDIIPPRRLHHLTYFRKEQYNAASHWSGIAKKEKLNYQCPDIRNFLSANFNTPALPALSMYRYSRKFHSTVQKLKQPQKPTHWSHWNQKRRKHCRNWQDAKLCHQGRQENHWAQKIYYWILPPPIQT